VRFASKIQLSHAEWDLVADIGLFIDPRLIPLCSLIELSLKWQLCRAARPTSTIRTVATGRHRPRKARFLDSQREKLPDDGAFGQGVSNCDDAD
jgi:hypothetical protein